VDVCQYQVKVRVVWAELDGREGACFRFGGAAQPEECSANSEFACQEFESSSTPLRASGSASANRSLFDKRDASQNNAPT